MMGMADELEPTTHPNAPATTAGVLSDEGDPRSVSEADINAVSYAASRSWP